VVTSQQTHHSGARFDSKASAPHRTTVDNFCIWPCQVPLSWSPAGMARPRDQHACAVTLGLRRLWTIELRRFHEGACRTYPAGGEGDVGRWT
jgi:hypothetical protein